MSRKKKIILIAVIILAVAGMIFFGLRNYIFFNAPERTVMRFLGDIENKKFDDSLKYVWPSERDKIITSSNILKSVSSVEDSNTQIKFTKLKYKTVKLEKNSAKISVQGKLNYQFFNASKEDNFNRSFELIRDGKTWYIKSFLQQ
jgi:hypothetical protein